MIVREEIINEHEIVGRITEDNSWFVAELIMKGPDGNIDQFNRTAPDYDTALAWIDESLEDLRHIEV